jgi:hypothetical protein
MGNNSDENRISIEEAKQTVTFALDEPAEVPIGYELNQVSVRESGDVCSLVYTNETGDPETDLGITARSAKDPRMPGHPCGVDEEIMVNDRPGTYARTDYEIIGSLPAGISDPAELQDGIVEFINSSETYYYIIGRLEKDELIQIAESIEENERE